MFRIEEQKDPITWPVDVRIPQDGGKVRKSRFTAHFLLIGDDEYDRILEENPQTGDSILIRRVLVGWGEKGKVDADGDVKNGIYDAEGNPMQFTKDNLEILLKIAYFRFSVLTDYTAFKRGLAAAKN